MSNVPRSRVLLAFFGSVFAGGLTAVQARINGQLGYELQNGIFAALISFAVGWAVIAVIVVSRRDTRAGVRRLRGHLSDGTMPVWMLLGGVAGAFFVSAQALTVGVLGVSLFTLGVVAGQVSASVLFDSLGFGPSGRVSASLVRVVGAALALVAVLIAVWSQLGAVHAVWMVVVAVLGGVVIAWQAAVNGHINRFAESSPVAALVNFTTGTVALIVAAAFSVVLLGWPSQWPSEFWVYWGGPLGVIFITLASQYVRIIGVLLLGMANIAGQLIGALILDAVVPISQFTLSLGLFIGAALALSALVLAGWRELSSRA